MLLMRSLKQVYQNKKLVWEPFPGNNLIKRYQIEDGIDLSSNITEDIAGIGLCRRYSVAQLRKIKQIQNTKYNNKKTTKTPTEYDLKANGSKFDLPNRKNNYCEVFL